MREGWKYYNHALIPTAAPHENVKNLMFDREFWKNTPGGYPLLARWTSDFDCGYETAWWYVIKDTPFDINTLKAKRRYEINKGKKNFEIRIVDPIQYGEDLYQITIDAYAKYPRKYKPNIDKRQFIENLVKWRKYEVYVGIYKETGKICGYSWINIEKSYIDLCALKTISEYEKYGINAALVNAIVEKHNIEITEKYLCDGARSTLHETNFQDYLEKYFGFRKAYCILNIKYRLLVKVVVGILYPIRTKIKGKSKIGARIKAVLLMEECSRKCKLIERRRENGERLNAV